MKKIGLLSDTHGDLPDRLFTFFENCDEIWHAGDIGNMETIQRLSEFRFLRAVYGNIDEQEIRMLYPMHLRFYCENVDVWITHIGGYPGHYDRIVRSEIERNPPKLFICGHSHILRVIYDKKLDLLYLNPGAAGKSGFHRFRTALRFVIDGKEIREMEIWQTEKATKRLSD
jgi:uncharacterized protein